MFYIERKLIMFTILVFSDSFCDNFGKDGSITGTNAKGTEKILYVKNC
jgi:hypothetical protein